MKKERRITRKMNNPTITTTATTNNNSARRSNMVTFFLNFIFIFSSNHFPFSPFSLPSPQNRRATIIKQPVGGSPSLSHHSPSLSHSPRQAVCFVSLPPPHSPANFSSSPLSPLPSPFLRILVIAEWMLGNLGGQQCVIRTLR